MSRSLDALDPHGSRGRRLTPIARGWLKLLRARVALFDVMDPFEGEQVSDALAEVDRRIAEMPLDDGPLDDGEGDLARDLVEELVGAGDIEALGVFAYALASR
jgi:hypothetical protein